MAGEKAWVWRRICGWQPQPKSIARWREGENIPKGCLLATPHLLLSWKVHNILYNHPFYSLQHLPFFPLYLLSCYSNIHFLLRTNPNRGLFHVSIIHYWLLPRHKKHILCSNVVIVNAACMHNAEYGKERGVSLLLADELIDLKWERDMKID